MTERKKRNNASKSEEKITRNIRKNLKEKQLLYSKKEKGKALTYHHHGRLMQNFESLKDKSNQN
jgi:hypothetical protein